MPRKIQEFMNRDTENVQPEMSHYTGNNWSHQNSKEKFGSHTRRTVSRVTTADSCTWNVTQYCSLSGGDRRWFNGRSTGKSRPETADGIIIIIINQTLSSLHLPIPHTSQSQYTVCN